MKLINDELASSICEQLGHEKFNANLYLYIAGFLKNKGFDNLAKHFEEQHDEETNHSKMIYGLLTDLNSEVIVPEIDDPTFPINSILDVAKAYLDREILTTESLNEIKKQAIEDDNCIVEEFVRGMITLQQNELSEATDFDDKAQIIGEDWKWVLMWDLGL